MPSITHSCSPFKCCTWAIFILLTWTCTLHCSCTSYAHPSPLPSIHLKVLSVVPLLADNSSTISNYFSFIIMPVSSINKSLSCLTCHLSLFSSFNYLFCNCAPFIHIHTALLLPLFNHFLSVSVLFHSLLLHPLSNYLPAHSNLNHLKTDTLFPNALQFPPCSQFPLLIDYNETFPLSWMKSTSLVLLNYHFELMYVADQLANSIMYFSDYN